MYQERRKKTKRTLFRPPAAAGRRCFSSIFPGTRAFVWRYFNCTVPQCGMRSRW